MSIFSGDLSLRFGRGHMTGHWGLFIAIVLQGGGSFFRLCRENVTGHLD
jgi:hypothetical protein